MERIAGTEARVTRAWQGKTVVCIGGGPSLTLQDLELVRRAREADRVRVIVVNDQYLVAPWADLLYFADARWYEWHSAGLEKKWPWASFSADETKRAFDTFAGEKVTIRLMGSPNKLSAERTYPNTIARLANLGCENISDRPEGIHTGKNGGYQAMNIAVLAGGNPILLVAYDMRFHGDRTHSHNGHPQPFRESSYTNVYAKAFHTAANQLNALGVRVINCTPGSAIRCFPTSSIEKELAEVCTE